MATVNKDGTQISNPVIPRILCLLLDATLITWSSLARRRNLRCEASHSALMFQFRYVPWICITPCVKPSLCLKVKAHIAGCNYDDGGLMAKSEATHYTYETCENRRNIAVMDSDYFSLVFITMYLVHHPEKPVRYFSGNLRGHPYRYAPAPWKSSFCLLGKSCS